MLKAISVVKESNKHVEDAYQDSVIVPLDQEDERDIDEEKGDGKDDDLGDRFVDSGAFTMKWRTLILDVLLAFN